MGAIQSKTDPDAEKSFVIKHKVEQVQTFKVDVYMPCSCVE